MNHFTLHDAAQRYAQGRPYFHPVVIEKIAHHLNLTVPLKRAADIGCGTGLSALALTSVASQVIGLDPSLEMLQLATPHPSVDYLVARAEYIPLGTHQFELLTVSSAFYWFERNLFFAEVRRLLQPGGWLVIYDNAFENEMVGNPEFNNWIREVFWSRYPYPTSLNSFKLLQADEAFMHSFDLEETHYHNLWRFSLPELADYLLSLSNMTAVIERASESPDQIRQWLGSELAPFFSQENHEFQFGGPLLYLHLR